MELVKDKRLFGRVVGAVIVCLVALVALQGYSASGQIPPIAGQTGQATNIGRGAADFLFVEGYTPWAVLVINAGDPSGVDSVTVSFNEETKTLRIEAIDGNSTNHVTILVNKAFADNYIGDAEGNLDIQTSNAVNYKGLNTSNATIGGGAAYVFQINGFSTQTISISRGGDFLPLLMIAALAVVLVVAAVVVIRKRGR